jgi:hypothetical protein
MRYRRRASRNLDVRSLVAGAIGLALVIAIVVVALAVARSHQQTPAKTAMTPSARPACGSSGCALVSLSRTLPPTTVFYGASCTGVYGSWFLNVVEGGGNDELRPSYTLRWSFAPSAQVANPSGSITVPATSTTQISLTLNQGTLSLTGTRKPNVRVAATGTLVVELAGPTTAPELVFTETGLAKAESALGLVSPFDVGGKPLSVPLTTVKTMSSC